MNTQLVFNRTLWFPNSIVLIITYLLLIKLTVLVVIKDLV